MVADLLLETELRDRLAGVFEQRLAECGIGPGPRHDLRADMRPDLRLVGLDDRIERRRIDVALFRQDRFERPDPELHFRQLGAVLVVMVMIMPVPVPVLMVVVVVVRHCIPFAASIMECRP